MSVVPFSCSGLTETVNIQASYSHLKSLTLCSCLCTLRPYIKIWKTNKQNETWAPSKYSTFTENLKCAGCSARHRGWWRKKSSSLPVGWHKPSALKSRRDAGGNCYWTHSLNDSDWGRILKKDHGIIVGAKELEHKKAKYQISVFEGPHHSLSLFLGSLEIAQVPPLLRPQIQPHLAYRLPSPPTLPFPLY